MRIASISLRNFKRFTDLTLRDVPETGKLVVVVGPNGCGKSSLFDALLQWYYNTVGFGWNAEELYYRKDAALPFLGGGSVQVSLHGGVVPQKGSLYVRTAYRNDPDFSISSFDRPRVPSQERRLSRLIENDQTVSENYRRLVYETMAGVYDAANNDKTVQILREELIGQVRDSMARVFGDLLLNSISDPLGAGSFFFDKGTARAYHYKNLSGGEKAAFDLLLDLHIKKRFFNDGVYCIDEIETHLHTKVQGVLLREMVNILPAGSQLWVTTHSLGVLRAAQEMATTDPSSVCVFDFEGVNTDTACELVPSNLGRVSWNKLLSIAIDDLSPRIAPKFVVVCEGSTLGVRRKDFDAEVYEKVLGAHYPDIVFVSGGSANQLQASGVCMGGMLNRIVPLAKTCTLIDRDDKSDAEKIAFESQGGIVLSLRNLESYLLADDVIEALVIKEQKMPQLADVLRIKQQAIADSVARGNPPDDLKSAAGDIYTNIKRLLGLQRCGDSKDSFMRDTLAPLIRPGMTTYNQFKADIIDKIPQT